MLIAVYAHHCGLCPLLLEAHRCVANGDAISAAQSLAFQTVLHQPVTIDCQPTPNGVLIFVCGNLIVTSPPRTAARDCACSTADGELRLSHSRRNGTGGR